MTCPARPCPWPVSHISCPLTTGQSKRPRPPFIMKVQGPGQSLPRSVSAQAWGLPQPTAPMPCGHRHMDTRIHAEPPSFLRPDPASPHYRLGFRELFLFMTRTRPPPRKEQSGGSSWSLASMRLSLHPGSRSPSEPLMGVFAVLPTRGCWGGHLRV